MQRGSFVASLAGLALGGCAHATNGARFQDIADGGEPLRSTFNRDGQNVRIVMLVSPT
ncbi:MAG TPA: hypothetical protein VGI19_03490 [Candidatus Cybelea sp.]|jgi:hypothetical protein